MPNNARFWSKVKKTASCWFWERATFTNGYGAFQVEGRALRAHRVAWELTNGPVPEGLFVLHRCDNPGCVNPAHLFLGTAAENMKDRDQKGRQARGDKHGTRRHPESRERGSEHWTRRHPELVPHGDTSGRAKLSAEEVRRIREEHIPYKVTYEALAKKYGVTSETIGRIIRGEFWKNSNVVI